MLNTYRTPEMIYYRESSISTVSLVLLLALKDMAMMVVHQLFGVWERPHVGKRYRYNAVVMKNAELLSIQLQPLNLLSSSVAASSHQAIGEVRIRLRAFVARLV